jgi:mannan endo-1,4-beta-mannosidase
MKWRIVVAAILFLVLAKPVPLVAQMAATGAEPVPANPNASPEARALLRYLYSISGQHTLAGVHNFPNSISRWTDRAYDLTGKYPALFGQDFGFAGGDDKDSVEARPAMIQEVKRQYENGAIITLTWHEVRPTFDEPVQFRENVLSHLSDFEWHELLTPGTDLNKRWCDQVDQVAASLKQLQDSGVPVLWRPYPESNGSKFWWAGRKGVEGSAELYRRLFDRLVNVRGLRNLIWVWVADAPGFGPNSPGRYSDFFPGLVYVDALSLEISGGGFRFPMEIGLSQEGGGKVVGLELSGKLPAPDLFTQQPRWAWFIVSPEVPASADQSDALRAVYLESRVVSRAAESGAGMNAHPK